MRLVDRRVEDDGRHAEFHRLEVGRVRLHFGHEHVHALGQFQREFVGSPVTSPDERQPIPVEPVGRGAVLGVRPPPVADDDAILVVADPVVVAEIWLRRGYHIAAALDAWGQLPSSHASCSFQWTARWPLPSGWPSRRIASSMR